MKTRTTPTSDNPNVFYHERVPLDESAAGYRDISIHLVRDVAEAYKGWMARRGFVTDQGYRTQKQRAREGR